jgi:hypothetical protein
MSLELRIALRFACVFSPALHMFRHPVPARQETIDRAGRIDFAILVNILVEVLPHCVASSSFTRNGAFLPPYTCGIGLASSTDDSNFVAPLLNAADKVRDYARVRAAIRWSPYSGNDSAVRLTVSNG